MSASRATDSPACRSLPSSPAPAAATGWKQGALSAAWLRRRHSASVDTTCAGVRGQRAASRSTASCAALERDAGVSPEALMTPGSARACTNSIVHVETEAQCSGVRPSASRAFGSARSASRRSATAEWQFATASESGVMGSSTWDRRRSRRRPRRSARRLQPASLESGAVEGHLVYCVRTSCRP